jgi:hypothetical protein
MTKGVETARVRAAAFHRVVRLGEWLVAIALATAISTIILAVLCRFDVAGP